MSTAEVSVTASDKVVVTMSKAVAGRMKLISRLLECVGDSPSADATIPVSNVDSATLNKVIEWINYRLVIEAKVQPKSMDDVEDDEEEDTRFAAAVTVSDEDEAFMLGMPTEQLLTVLNASNFLDVPDLMGVITQKIADFCKDKSAETLRKFFIVDNDYTDEELAEVEKELSWCTL